MNKGVSNNSLMKGFDMNGPKTLTEKEIERIMNDFKSTFLTSVIRQFLDVLQSNSLLGVECLFRFTSKEIKDSIINNYEDIGGNRTAVRGQ